MTTTDLIFGLGIFIGVIWLIVNTMRLSGTKMDDELKSTKKQLDNPNKEPPFIG
jgi:uncharacterized membrane-anchored protein YhcB (DUF1043 family)